MRPFLVWFLIAPLLAFGQSATAQELAQDRAPRFLLALDSRLTPVDIERTPLLGRRLSLSLDGATIKEALGEIVRQSGLRLAYGDDVLPPDGRVHLRAEGITVVAALTDVLFDTDVDVVFSPNGRATLVRRPDRTQGGAVAGRVTDSKSGQPIVGASIVLAGTRWHRTTDDNGAYKLAEVTPGTYTLTASRIGYTRQSQSVTVAPAQEATVDLRLEVSASPLDAVVVTGTLVPTEVKALPTPVTVLTSDDIEGGNVRRVDQLFRGQVAGAVAWDEGPGAVISVINMRGNSSLTVAPSIKTYIDGVELASSQYISTIDPSSIDRIEITHGPQASTLYGDGALNGVMQIFTKKGRIGLTRPEVTAKLSVGSVSGWNGQSAALQTDNGINVLGGDEKTGYNIEGTYRHVGDFMPSFASNDWNISTGVRTTQGPVTLSGSIRYTAKTSDLPWDTRFQAYTGSFYSQPPDRTERIRQQTYGITATWQATPQWRHTLTLGYDQNFGTLYQTRPQLTTPSDTLVSLDFEFHDARTSLLYHTDVNVPLGRTMAAILTAGMAANEEDVSQFSAYGATRTTGSLNGSLGASRRLLTATGYFGQVQLSLAERLFVTGGVRAERNDNFGAAFGTAWSPRVGAAYTANIGAGTVKLRASYGESIRAPYAFETQGYLIPGCCQAIPNDAIRPERQRGADGGVDLYVGQASLGVTYYNQRATDLIDAIAVPSSGGLSTVQYQNLNRVKNEGWEFEGHLTTGPVRLGATYSVTHSTVQELPPNFSGDYRIGDQVLGTPHSSAGATVTYAPLPTTTLTGSMTYFGHWTEHDYIALFGYYYGGQPYRGSDRAYWIEYPVVMKVAFAVSQRLANSVTAFARVENIGNSLRPEETNLNIPTPRSLLVGANLSY
jgi:outer membrane receptor protein involved in Fe transport